MRTWRGTPRWWRAASRAGSARRECTPSVAVGPIPPTRSQLSPRGRSMLFGFRAASGRRQSQPIRGGWMTLCSGACCASHVRTSWARTHVGRHGLQRRAAVRRLLGMFIGIGCWVRGHWARRDEGAIGHALDEVGAGAPHSGSLWGYRFVSTSACRLSLALRMPSGGSRWTDSRMP